MRSSSYSQKRQTNSSQELGDSTIRGSRVGYSPARVGYSPGKSDAQQRNSIYETRFKRKDLKQFNPIDYRSATLTQDDVMDLKQVFDYYDSQGMGVLLPNDLKLLLTENGFNPNKKTVYEIIAEFDVQQTGGISFRQFMNAMHTKPYLNERKKDIMKIFKKYDHDNKGYIDLQDIQQINRLLKESLDEQTLKMMLQRADSNRDGKISFEDFYSVMIKSIY